MLVRAARTVARLASPAVHNLGGSRLLAGAEAYAAFMAGKGSGSGWDAAGEAGAVSSFIRSSAPIIFDVGANDGRWSLEMARALKSSDARFYLMEPADYCFPGIEARRPGIPNITVVQCAVSESDGTAMLHMPERGSGLASLHERRDVSVVQEQYRQVDVVTRSLDSLTSELGVTSVDLLKMDIEGHELLALRGASGLLGAGAIKALTFEFSSANVNSRTFFRDYWELLTGHGYKLHRIIPGGATTPIKRYSEDLEYFRGATNYVASLT